MLRRCPSYHHHRRDAAPLEARLLCLPAACLGGGRAEGAVKGNGLQQLSLHLPLPRG